MKAKEGCLVLLIGSVLAQSGLIAAEKPKIDPVPAPPKELAKLDLANSKDASLPDGSSVVKGSWSVDAAAKKLLAAPVPLVDAWLEFGPEIREKGATITASGRVEEAIGTLRAMGLIYEGTLDVAEAQAVLDEGRLVPALLLGEGGVAVELVFVPVGTEHQAVAVAQAQGIEPVD